MAGLNGTITSISAYISSPASAAPNNKFQVAVYSDNGGSPGTLLASSASQTITPDAWNTVPISAPVTAKASTGSSTTQTVLPQTRTISGMMGGATSTWITSQPFGTWPATFGPVGGSSSYSASMYCAFQ